MSKVEKVLRQYPHVWKTESALMSYIRGGIRRSLWNRSPIKLEFIKKNRIRIPNPNPRGKVAEVWGGVCSLTGTTLPLKDLEVDHLEGNHSLKSMDDIRSFIEAIVLVTEDDLAFVSKDAHRVKTYAQKENISFEEALAIKKAIAICKAKKDKEWLEEKGIIPASNQAKRRKQIEEALQSEAVKLSL